MITAARRKSLSLAGLMFVKVNALRVVRHSGNPSKPVILWATDSGAQNARRNFGGSTCAGESSVSNYLPDSQSCAGGCVAHHTASYKLPQRNKKGLRPDGIPVYGYSAPAKSGAGIGVLGKYKATHDAPSVFFCVLTFAHPFFSAAVIIRAACRVMVSWMGAEKSAPVTLYAGYANPVQLTTSEIGVSGGGINPQYKEAAIVATTPTQNPQFIWLIAAVRRDMPTITAKIHHIAAETEQEARRSLARDHVCFFAGRIRTGGAHA